MGAIASQITSLTIVYSTVYSDADQRKQHSSASLAFVWGIHRGPANSLHKWPVTRKMFPFDDVIIELKAHLPCFTSVIAGGYCSAAGLINTWSLDFNNRQAEPWWRASIWRSHRKVVIKQCSYHNNIIDIQNRLPYSKVVFSAIIVLFSCLMEVNHGVRTGPKYPFK